MNKKDYKVGQIIYTILTKENLILPLRIIEVAIIKKLNSEETKYKVEFPLDENLKIINLEKFKNVFETLKSAEEYLLNNAKNAINLMMQNALEFQKDYFEVEFEKEEDLNKDLNMCKNENGDVRIELENGQKVLINPDFLPKNDQETILIKETN